jgi:hypothetical protein
MANLKNTVIDDTGNLKLPTGTSAQRPGSPIAGQFRYNTSLGILEAYTGGVNQWITTASRGARATGGTVYDVDVDGTTYRVHVFTTIGNSNFTVTRAGTVEYLIVAGGGGGAGGRHGAGGGAGGLLTGVTSVISGTTYTVTVGQGGAGGADANAASSRGTSGANSSFAGFTSIGGGAGGSRDIAAGLSGGSGGGTARSNTFAAGTAGQGNRGGTGNAALNGQGAGGGGAGEQGGDALVDRPGGTGGIGLVLSISGNSQFYAGGGGGGGAPYRTNGTPGPGGFGGGGDGNNFSTPGVSGTPNTGGGGGGQGGDVNAPNTAGAVGGSGGSGIVIIRYPLQSEPDVTQIKVSGDSLLLELDFAKSTVYPGTGTIVYDSRLNGLTATRVNNPLYESPRTQRSNFVFQSASSQYLNAGTINLQQNFTLEIWTRRIANTDHSMFGQGPTVQNQGLHIIYTIGARGMVWGMFGNDLEYGDNYRPSIGIWYHWVFTYNHSTFAKQFYADGLLQTPTGGVQNQYAGSGQFNIGAIYSGALAFANGNIAVSRVYNRVLSASEISNNFNVDRWRFGR